MDELEELCARLVGDRALAVRLVGQAGDRGERTARIGRVLAAAREAAAPPQAAAHAQAPCGRDLAEAVAGELARATMRTPPRQREVMALREYLGLTHAEIARVTGADPAAVAALLAAARLRLRDELRCDPPAPEGGGETCPERDRALRTITLRQDREHVSAADEDWLLGHLGHCAVCAQGHAAMLEASARYRAWPMAAGRAESADLRREAGSSAG